jgi:folate-binding protein YgfZ
MHQGCGLWRRPATRGLLLTGEDRQRLLNGLVTCEVKTLAPGEGALGFFTDAKGHILSPVVVRAAEDHLWLELLGGQIPAIADHIEKYIVVDRVEVSVSAELVPLTLVGAGATTLTGKLLGGQEVPDSAWGHRETQIGEVRVRISMGVELGVAALTLWAPESAIPEILQSLQVAAGPDALFDLSDESVEVLRVEAGMPRFRVDYDSDNLPQETGLQEAVSYTKGCFLGQEVVARLQYRGQVARQVAKLEVEVGEPPAVGTRVLLEAREAGRLTSVASSPGTGKITALAMLQRRAIEPGTELDFAGGGKARVV